MPDLDTLVGTTVAGFRLVSKLGEGGMAVVFRGENVVNADIRRAIKIVHSELAQRPEFRRRFSDEARIVEELVHPNVVRFYGLREEVALGGTLLLMELELLEGETLAATLVHGAIAERDALKYLADAAAGVAAAHARGIVHRDLKPANLFLTVKRVVKVLDFGIARALDQLDRGERVTRTGTLVGTAAYMAPEVCNGKTPTAAADVYALGVSLAELLLGHHPYASPGEEAKSTPQMMFAHVSQPIPPIPGTSAATLELIRRATAKEVKDRYANAEDLLTALRSVGEAGRLPAAVAVNTSFELTPFAPAVSQTGYPKPAPAPAAAAQPAHPRRGSGSRAPGVGMGVRIGVGAVGMAGLAGIAAYALRRGAVPSDPAVLSPSALADASVDAAPSRAADPATVIELAAEGKAAPPALDAALHALAPPWKGKVAAIVALSPSMSEIEIARAFSSATEGTALVFARGKYAFEGSLRLDGKRGIAVVAAPPSSGQPGVEIFVETGKAVLAATTGADLLVYGVYMNHHAPLDDGYKNVGKDACDSLLWNPILKTSNVLDLDQMSGVTVVDAELEGSGFIAVHATHVRGLAIRGTKLHDCIAEGIKLEDSTADVDNSLLYKVGNRRYPRYSSGFAASMYALCKQPAQRICKPGGKDCFAAYDCSNVMEGEAPFQFLHAVSVDKTSSLAMTGSTVVVPAALSGGTAFDVAGVLRVRQSVVVEEQGFVSAASGAEVVVEGSCVTPPHAAATVKAIDTSKNTMARAVFVPPSSASDAFSAELVAGSCDGAGAKLSDPVLHLHAKPVPGGTGAP